MDNREKWVDRVLNSTEGLQKAEGNPFLYEKIQYRMQQQNAPGEGWNRKYMPRLVAIVSCILVINCVSVLHSINKEKKTEGTATQVHIAQEINNGTTYNY